MSAVAAVFGRVGWSSMMCRSLASGTRYAQELPGMPGS